MKEVVSEETSKLNKELAVAREHLEQVIADKNSLEAQLREMKLSTPSHVNIMETELATVHERLSHQLSKIADLEDKNIKLEEKRLKLEEDLRLSNKQQAQSVSEIRSECQLKFDAERSKWDEAMEKLREELERQKTIVSKAKNEHEVSSTDTEETLRTLQKGLRERDETLAGCKLRAETEQKRLESENSSLKEQLRCQECDLKELQEEVNQMKAERSSCGCVAVMCNTVHGCC